MLWNEGQLQSVLKETKPALRVGECFQWKAHGQCSNGDLCIVSVMTYSPVETRAKVTDEKDDRLLPHQIRIRNRLTVRDKNPQKNQTIKKKALQTKGAKFHADSNSVKIRHVDSGILPCV